MKFANIFSQAKSIFEIIPKQIICAPVFWWLFPISIVLPILFGQIDSSNFKNIALWLLIGTLAHLSMYPFVIYGKSGRSINEQFYLLIVMGGVRGLVISLIPPILEMRDELSLISRVSASVISVFYWNIFGSIVFQYGSVFRNKVKELLNEILEKQIIGIPTAARSSSHELTRIIGHLQERISETVGTSPSKAEILAASKEIDNLIIQHIKPLSKSQWRDGQLTWLRAGLFSVIGNTLKSTKIPVVGVVLISMPFALVTQTGRIGFFGSLIVQSIWISITFLLNWLIFRSNSLEKTYRNNLQFLSGLVFIAYPITFILQSNIDIANPIYLETKIQGYLVSTIVEILLFLIGALLISVRNEQEFAFEFLKGVISRGELENLITKTRSGNSDAQFAQYLHAEVQSQLLACKLLLLKAAESNFELFPPEITQQIMERMEKISQPFDRPVARITSKRVRELSQSWVGLASITSDLPSELDILHPYSDVVSQLIEEAVVNSIRHGGANEIKISAEFSGTDLKIRVSNDGILGTASGSRGLGSILFDTFSKEWSLTSEDGQTVLLFVIDTTQKEGIL